MTDLHNDFTEFEEKNRLLIDNPYAYVWEGLRFGIFRTLVAEMHQTKEAQDRLASPRGSVSLIMRHYLGLCRDYISSKVHVAVRLKRYRGRPYFFWGNPRRRLETDGYYWDDYVDPLLEQIDPDSFVVFESKILGSHREPAKTKALIYPDYMRMEQLFQRLFSKKKHQFKELDAFYSEIDGKLFGNIGTR